VKLLLDTCTLLWAADQPELLSAEVRRRLESGERPLVSVASLWEIAIKIQKGKLALQQPAATLAQMIADLGADLVPVRMKHALGLLKLQPHHKDPFDRILVATAVAESVAIATPDDHIRAYPVDIVW
jgi:PIN domain nuclease of toxin-antitoxin system